MHSLKIMQNKKQFVLDRPTTQRRAQEHLAKGARRSCPVAHALIGERVHYFSHKGNCNSKNETPVQLDQPKVFTVIPC